ncbi:YceI family protein [Aureisphaera galaxeae]|uniref:YceI family protein n=1 Tax=Aureisphaera galaxeae TaxID=1538023 RepID=UPI0023507EB3|nr:YceI family protein [Aureisphaera galaxeae]MDC8003390.1 YceI family protein [Aureisphaera galaxeae]
MKRTKLQLLLLLFVALASFSFYEITTDKYALDPGHTHIGFDVERFMVGEVSGRFNEATATIEMDGDDYTSLKVKAVIQVNSLDSNNETRDGHLKGAFWLDAATYPEIIFESTGVSKVSNGYEMSGNFTLHGVTKEITFPVEVSGPFKDPTQSETIGIKADFTIDRFDYGIAMNKKMKNGALFIGKDVKIKIRVLALKK